MNEADEFRGLVSGMTFDTVFILVAVGLIATLILYFSIFAFNSLKSRFGSPIPTYDFPAAVRGSGESRPIAMEVPLPSFSRASGIISAMLLAYIVIENILLSFFGDPIKAGRRLMFYEDSRLAAVCLIPSAIAIALLAELCARFIPTSRSRAWGVAGLFAVISFFMATVPFLVLVWLFDVINGRP